MSRNRRIRILKNPEPRLGINGINRTTSLDKNINPSLNHRKRSKKERKGLNVINNARSNLNSLTETHIIALEPTTNEYFRAASPVGNESSINFFIEHPVDAVSLVLKVGE
jgi:hypothetical protein